MSIEQLAMLGIGVFGFIAIVRAYSMLLGMKRAHHRAEKRKTEGRYRRPVGVDSAAASIAEGLIVEVIKKHEILAAEARDTGQIPKDLEPYLEEAQMYYRARVESRLRPLFHEAVNKVVLDQNK